MQNNFNNERVINESINESYLDINEFIYEAKQQLKEYNILKKGTFSNINLEGIFEENYWVVDNELKGQYDYFDFTRLEGMVFNGVGKEHINIIKCWVIDILMESKYEEENEVIIRSTDDTSRKLRELIKFIEETSNFNSVFLEDKRGSKIEEYFEGDFSEATKRKKIQAILSFIDFGEEFFLEQYGEIGVNYINKLNELYSKVKIKNKPRKLPHSKDILIFGNYIDIFFNDLSVDIKTKLYFMPILLWWKITTVIPMRPSEFCRKIKRDCLINEDDNYYLKINRVKKKVDLKRKLLPVLKRVKITKEIYELIAQYINLTKEYGHTETLISYRAQCEVRKEMNVVIQAKNHTINYDIFTRVNLQNLIDNFYDEVIYSKYNDTLINEKVLPGDTRHIAFTSLMLQGYSPIEIAIIGGHRTLDTLYNYTCSPAIYIDNEVITIISENIKLETSENAKSMDIIYNMPIRCPKKYEECFPADIDGVELGVCTADFKRNINSCESDDCYKCSNWWCEPTDYNFISLEKIVRSKIKIKNNKLNRSIDFMMNLLKERGLEVVDGKLVMDKTIANELKRASLELEAATKEIIHLKYELTSPNNNKFKLLNDINELLPTNEIDNQIKALLNKKNKEQ